MSLLLSRLCVSQWGSNAVTNSILAISLLVASFSFFYYFKDRSVNRLSFKLEYQKGLQGWYAETIHILILLNCIEERHKRQELLCKLSGQIEIGRFYFPNIDKNDGFGTEKPLAYRGYRNLTLDFLVYSYDIHSLPTYTENLKTLMLFQREFTSIVINTIRPGEDLKSIKNITDKYFIEEKVFEDYLKTSDPESINNILASIYEEH